MRLGIIGDIHEPFCHPMYQRFIQDTFEAWGVTKTHFIGDIVDGHALGFWDHNPNGMSAGNEHEKAYEGVQSWYNLFPNSTVSIGNHDERHFRVARKAGIPDNYVKGYKIVWGTPKWDWQLSHKYDDTLLEHGTGTSGKDGAINRAIEKRCNLIIGHIHSYAGVKFHTSDYSRIFGMNVGCGIDIDGYAFDYGKPFAIRPVLGCGILIDNVYPYFEIMPCGPGEKYHRSRA